VPRADDAEAQREGGANHIAGGGSSNSFQRQNTRFPATFIADLAAEAGVVPQFEFRRDIARVAPCRPGRAYSKDGHPSRPKRPRDPSQLGKLIVDISTGDVEDSLPPTEDGTKTPEAVFLGTMGGRKGGKARAAALSPERRKEIARIAARKRWDKRR